MNTIAPIQPLENIDTSSDESIALLKRIISERPDMLRDLLKEMDVPLPTHSSGASPAYSRVYDESFTVTEDYRASLPDLQNGKSSLIQGARTSIQHVGISNFRLPLVIAGSDSEATRVDASVTGTVSLDAHKKGINMSRVMRTFYAHAKTEMTPKKLEELVDRYMEDLESRDARIQVSLEYPMLITSLRSGLQGYQYYTVSLEYFRNGDERRRLIHLDYVYSSTCPCSLELSEHARTSRGQLATPHSQRSVARLSAVISNDVSHFPIEEIVSACRRAIPTETQVMVKREDEQAFAELNAANPIFVEDAARLLFVELDELSFISDFRIAASHQESLHSHDAISILSKGATFDSQSVDPEFFKTLHHVK